MSRGGFRGRGRGRGGGGGIGPGGKFEIPGQSDMSKQEWSDLLFERSKHSGMLYPPLETKLVAHLPGPTPFEENTIHHSISLSNHVNHGRLPIGHHRGPTPWRLISERKVVGIEIETWSDRVKEQQQPASSGSGNGSGSKGGSSTLDKDVLYLDQGLFPPVLWDEVFESEEAAEAKRKKAGKDGLKKKKMRLDSPDGDDDDADQQEEEKSQAGSESDIDIDFDFEDDEEDHQDYDANYFDNGEGDDDDDGGGEEDGDGGGNDYD